MKIRPNEAPLRLILEEDLAQTLINSKHNRLATFRANPMRNLHVCVGFHLVNLLRTYVKVSHGYRWPYYGDTYTALPCHNTIPITKLLVFHEPKTSAKSLSATSAEGIP